MAVPSTLDSNCLRGSGGLAGHMGNRGWLSRVCRRGFEAGQEGLGGTSGPLENAGKPVLGRHQVSVGAGGQAGFLQISLHKSFLCSLKVRAWLGGVVGFLEEDAWGSRQPALRGWVTP